MSDQKDWKMDLEEYIKQGEPGAKEKAEAWETAIGLQDVDGLKTSKYLLENAREHIEGKIDIATVKKRIQSYYEERRGREDIEDGADEADAVSARITEVLAERTFQFSPAEWKEIHRRLFDGVFDHAGKIRNYNITKSEWVLKGETVLYAAYGSIQATLDYDFKTEKEFSYQGFSVPQAVKHIAKFTSDIWQIHPYCEGNTRATAVFIIKYLKSFGFQIDNTVFKDNSWYFRNALVRANYSNIQKGISATTEYLERFFENLLMGKHNELKNRYLHLDYDGGKEGKIQSASKEISKSQNVTLKCTLEELALLKIIKDYPEVTQNQLAVYTGKSERTIKRKTVELQEKGYIRRKNGKRNGCWEVLIKLS